MPKPKPALVRVRPRQNPVSGRLKKFTLRLFKVEERAVKDGQAPGRCFSELTIVAPHADAAKKRAKKEIQSKGFVVESIHHAPNFVMIAYVRAS